MKTIFKIQKDGVNTLKEEILKHSNNKLVKLYIIIGSVKETGYDCIEELLIDLKAKKHIVLGIDKKNTTKKMLDNVLSYTRNVFVWDNNAESELNANVFVFEYEDEAIVITFSGDITDSLLETDTLIYTYTVYDLVKDKKEYADSIDTLTKTLKQGMVKLTKECISGLSENKKIFSTRQYLHTIPSISELLGSADDKTGETAKPECKGAEEKLPKVELDVLDDISFEIDLSEVKDATAVIEDGVEVKETSEIIKDVTELEESVENYENINSENEEEYVISDEPIDLEEVIFETETVRLDKKKVEKIIKDKKEKNTDKLTSKKIDLKKVSNIIMELPKKPTKGRDADSIKVPVYVKDMVPTFFETMEQAKLVEREDGKYKESNIRLEIIDVNSGEKHTDNNAKLSHRLGQTYVTFESDKLINIAYDEMDIARVIKLSKDSYHIEIIPSNMEEYNLWKKMCTNTFRGSSRQYGLM